MSPERQWLTAGEIKGLIAQENTSWRSEVREHNDKTEQALDAIRDGLQFAKNTNFLLVGNPEYGVKGFIPESLGRLGALETLVATTVESESSHHATNTARLDAIEDLQKLATSRNVRTRIKTIYVFLTRKGDDGQTGWARLVLTGTIFGMMLHYLVAWFPNWATWRVVLIKLSWIFRGVTR